MLVLFEMMQSAITSLCSFSLYKTKQVLLSHLLCFLSPNSLNISHHAILVYTVPFSSGRDEHVKSPCEDSGEDLRMV